MENNFVYNAGKNPEEVIEGLAELRAAIKTRNDYFQAKMRFERGDLVDIPAYRSGKIEELEKKYPRASVYLEAERWSFSSCPGKAELGSLAMGKILNGEDPEAVIQEMSKGLDAYFQALMEG